MTESILRALGMAFAMGWEILWPLILGFTLSAIVQAVVSHREMARLLPDDRAASIAKALALGAASSSCSYAAVAIARSLFRKGADFTAAMAFEMASTNLVVELAIIMLVFLGWQFTLAEFIGAPIMVALLVVLFRLFLSQKLLGEAKQQADKGLVAEMFSSPRSPSSTMRIFSSAEYYFRVTRRMSRASPSDGRAAGSSFCLVLKEPALMRYGSHGPARKLCRAVEKPPT